MGYAFESQPLTPETWSDLEELFDLPGGSIVRGCWCMFYRRTGTVLTSAVAAPENKRQLCELVDANVVPRESETGLKALFDDPQVTLVQVWNVIAGCWNFSVCRAE